MPKWVRASSGEKLVIQLSDNVYALAGRGQCMFANDPDTFYKYGYFDMEPKDVRIKMISNAVEDIRNTLEDLREGRAYRICVPPLEPEEAGKAAEEFLSRVTSK